jgi:hypothetical protein
MGSMEERLWRTGEFSPWSTQCGQSPIPLRKRGNRTSGRLGAGGHRAAAVYSPVQTCELNDVDPQAWLADVLAHLPDYPANRIADLPPWNWQAARIAVAA